MKRVRWEARFTLHVLPFTLFVPSNVTTSTGRLMIPMPADSNAASFSSAVPDDPEMMAPAWPIRRPLGAVCPAMKPTTGLVTLSFTKAAALCSSVPPISPITTMASVPGSS
jgi:hypothetical protein